MGQLREDHIRKFTFSFLNQMIGVCVRKRNVWDVTRKWETDWHDFPLGGCASILRTEENRVYCQVNIGCMNIPNNKPDEFEVRMTIRSEKLMTIGWGVIRRNASESFNADLRRAFLSRGLRGTRWKGPLGTNQGCALGGHKGLKKQTQAPWKQRLLVKNTRKNLGDMSKRGKLEFEKWKS